MQKISVYIVLLICVFILGLDAQTLKVTRTDADARKAGYVTATYLFGIDVSVDSLKRCNGIAFQLICDRPEYIKFSDAHVTGFGTNPQSLIVPGDSTNPGVLYVGILAGDTAGSAGYSDPQIIHLEFVATPSAINNDKVSFSFSNTEVVVSNDTSRVILKIKTSTFTYTVHGYTDVYPGDANNDGTVDIRDVSRIGVFLGYGDGKNGIRGFRRKDATTLWTPQQALAWDSVSVTYADCDGNGIVTINDMLLVALNYGKGWSGAQKDDNSPLAEVVCDEPAITSESVLVPVYANIPEDVKGLTARLILNSFCGGEYKGFILARNMKGKFFSFAGIVPEGTSVDMAVGSLGTSLIPQGRILLGYLVFENAKNNIYVAGLTDANAISESGNVIPLNYSTNVSESTDKAAINFRYFPESNTCEINNPSAVIYEIRLYDLTGSIIWSATIDGNTFGLPSGLIPGKYFISIITDGKPAMFNFVKN